MVWMLTETLITVTLKKGSAIKIHNEGAAQNVFIRFCLPGDSIRDHFDPRLLEVTIRSRELTVLKRSPASSAELPGSQTFCGNGLFQIGRMNQTCTLLVYHTLSQNCQDRWKYDTFFQWFFTKKHGVWRRYLEAKQGMPPAQGASGDGDCGWNISKRNATVAGKLIMVLLMKEIPNNHLGCIKPWKSWDINYQPQLVLSPDFWTINSISKISGSENS